MRANTSSERVADAPALTWPFPAWLPRAIGAAVAAMGLAVLAGWALDAEPLKAVLPGHVTMKANTALGFLLAGAGLWLAAAEGAGRRPVATVMALAAALLGLLTLAQYALGAGLGIDEALVHDDPDPVATSDPGRMAAGTALSFFLTGAAIVLLTSRGRRAVLAAQLLALTAAVIALVAFLGYLYDSPRLSGPSSYTRMAVHTSLGFIALCWGILALRPDRGPMAWLNTDTPGGASLRWLLPVAVAVPALGGWLRLRGEDAGLYDAEFGVAVFAFWNIAAFAALTLASAIALNRTDAVRREAERALRLNEATMRAMAEGAAEAMIMTDSAGVITYANRMSETLFGYPPEDLAGRPIDILVPERLRGRHEEFVAAYMTSPAIRGMGNGRELLAVRKDGGEFVAEISLAPVRTPAGPAVVTRVADITGRKRMEGELRLSEERYRTLIETSPEPVVVHRDGEIIFANTAAVRLAGAGSAASVIGRPMLGFVHPNDHGTVRDRLQRIAAGGVPVEREEMRVIRLDGHVIEVEAAATPITFEGQAAVQSLLHDVSDRKRAETTLRESEERLRAIVSGAPVIIWATDADGVITFSEGAALASVGIEPGQLARRRVADLYPDRPDIIDAHRRVLAGESFVTELALDGRSFHVQFAPLRDSRGTLTGALGVATDITGRKAAEDALRLSRQQLQDVLDNTHAVVSVKDTEGRYMLVNKRYESLIGKTPDELRGRTDFDLWPLETAETFRAHDHRIIETGAPAQFEETAVLADGPHHYISLKFPMRDAAGELYGVCTIATDVTERKRAEDALLASQRKLWLMFDTMADVMFLLKVEPDGRYRFESVNGPFLAATGLTLDQVLGRSVEEVLPPASRSLVLPKYREALQSGATVRWEETSDYPSSRRTGEVAVTPVMDSHGRCTHLLGSVHDITERRQAEQERMALGTSGSSWRTAC